MCTSDNTKERNQIPHFVVVYHMDCYYDTHLVYVMITSCPLFSLFFLMLLMHFIIWINVCCFLNNTGSYNTKWFATCLATGWIIKLEIDLMMVYQFDLDCLQNFIQYILNVGFGFLCVYMLLISNVDGNG